MIQALLFILVLHVGVNFIGYSLAGSQGTVTAVLASGITASDVTVPVTGAGTAGFPFAGYLYINGEAMKYIGVTGSCPDPFSTSPACFTNVSRGQLSTTARSAQAATTVYNEASGTFNELSNFETVSSVDELGNSTDILTSGKAWAGFFAHALTWDWPMFEGNFAVFRVFGVAMSIAVLTGAALALAQAARKTILG